MIIGLTSDQLAIYSALNQGDNSLLRATTTLNIQPMVINPHQNPKSYHECDMTGTLRALEGQEVSHITALKVNATMIGNKLFTNEHLEQFTGLTSFEIDNTEGELRTPLRLCSEFGLVRGAELLIQAGIDVNERNESVFQDSPFKGTALGVAKTVAVAQALIEKGATITEEVLASVKRNNKSKHCPKGVLTMIENAFQKNQV